MNKRLVFLTVVTLIAVLSSAPAATALQAETEKSGQVFGVERFVIAGSIDDREPVGIVDAYAASTEKVYCYLEAIDIKEDTMISFVWHHDSKEMASVTLPLRKGKRWRTYSSKKLAGLKGDWQVELRDADGTLVETVSFTVE